MDKRTKYFSDEDRRLIEATSKSTWTPPNPINLILPYMPEDDIEGEGDLEKRLRKSREVLEGYQRLEARCKEIREDLSERCKNVSITVDPEKDRRVLEAARRIFRRDVKEITFEMYKELVHRYAEMGNKVVPESARGNKRRLV